MLWLIVTILSYFFLSVVSLFDRYFLVGSIPNPKVYTFFIGIFGSFLALFLIPIGINFPELATVFLLGIGAGFVRIFAILFLAQSIVRSEVSRVVPAIGGFLPIFSFLLFFLFFPSQEAFNLVQIIAFLFLILGSVLISLKEFSLKFFSFQNLKYPIIASFLFAATYLLGKILFLQTDFLNGVFLILLGGGLGALSFLFFSESRKFIIHQKITQKISGLFILGQIFGALGVGALYYAIFLAEPFQIPLISALEGLRYVFLLFFIFLIGVKFPQILKEEMSRKVIYQKFIAILFVGAGLVLLIL